MHMGILSDQCSFEQSLMGKEMKHISTGKKKRSRVSFAVRPHKLDSGKEGFSV